MKLYELAYLILPDSSEEELNAIQEKINTGVQEEKGILSEINKPTKKILAYPIKKTMQAFLGSVNFQLNPENLSNLDKKLRNEEKIIRYLIITKKPKKLITERIRKPIKKFESSTIKADFPRKEKARLETIEQKLEEILKEP